MYEYKHCLQAIIFYLVVCALLLIVGILVRIRTNQNNLGNSLSSLALTTWIGGPPPAYYTKDGQPVWTDEQILTQSNDFDFLLYGTKVSGLFNAQLGLRLVYSGASNETIQDDLFDYTFRV